MNVYLYGEGFVITEENICEARGKYLIRTSIKNADKFIENECKKCRTVSEMTQKIPKIVGELILNVTQHMLYTLQLEGIMGNAKNYIDSTFQETGSVCQKVCEMLNEKADELQRAGVEKLNEIPDKLTAAAIMDLQNLWRGYFKAHGFSPSDEFFTPQQANKALQDLKMLSGNVPMVSAIKICVQALRDAPFDETVYTTTENFIGADKNLLAYKKLFSSSFKPGTYKDMKDPKSSEKLREEIFGKIGWLMQDREFQFKKYVYYLIDNNEKTLRKFVAAKQNYAHTEENERSFVCLDSTTMGGAEDGVLISEKGIYFHNDKEPPKFFHFNDIKTVTIDGMVSKTLFINGHKINTGGMSNSDVKRFQDLINRIRNLIAPLHEADKKQKPGKKEMNNFILSLRGNPKYHFESSVYFSNDTNEKTVKKFKGAISTYAKLQVDEYPLICYDGTVFGSADDGFMITSDGIHVKNMSEEKFFFEHEKIRQLGIYKNDIYINQKKVDTHGMSKEDRIRLSDLMKRTRDFFVHF